MDCTRKQWSFNETGHSSAAKTQGTIRAKSSCLLPGTRNSKPENIMGDGIRRCSRKADVSVSMALVREVVFFCTCMLSSKLLISIINKI